MKNSQKDQPVLSGNNFVKCPVELLCATELSFAARWIWLAIAQHCWGKKRTSWPSFSRLAKLTGASVRYVRDLITELESNGYLMVERRPGRVPIYTPVIPKANTNPDAIASRLSTQPRRYSVPVEVKSDIKNPPNPCTMTSGYPDAIASPKQINKTDKNNKPKTGNKGKRSAQKTPTDTKELRRLLDEIDVEKYRREWGPIIDFEAKWESFQNTILYGTPKNPNPNPYGYAERGFSLALTNWCSSEKNRNGSKPRQPRPPAGINLADYKY